MTVLDCLMVKLLLFGPVWLFSFLSAPSHFSDWMYSLIKVFLQTKGHQRTGCWGVGSAVLGRPRKGPTWFHFFRQAGCYHTTLSLLKLISLPDTPFQFPSLFHNDILLISKAQLKGDHLWEDVPGLLPFPAPLHPPRTRCEVLGDHLS